MPDKGDVGLTPDSIMTFFSSKLAKPTPLSKLRPQLGGTLLTAVVCTLMATCPFLAFLWHAARAVSYSIVKLDIERVKGVLYSYFLRLSVFFFVRAPGLKVHLYGDAKDIMQRNENVLYMSNHQSSVDWLIACLLAQNANCLDRIKFIMKQELHWVPIIGYYLKVLGHIFVRRKGFKPERLIEIVDWYTKTKTPIWLGIFPEGTRFNPEDHTTIAAAQEFSKNTNQPQLQHQLTPRPRGSWLLAHNLGQHLDAVYSVTLVYEQPEPKGQRRKAPTASDVLRGACSDVHVHIKRIPMKDVPMEEATFVSWLHQEFLDRDKRLAEYYSTRSFASWGPGFVDQDDGDTAHTVLRRLPDLLLLTMMVLALLLVPFVRTMYWVTALACTLSGYVSLHLQPPF